jgi:hypothetical protein
MRLRAVDIAAWLVIVASGIVLPVSALAALMLLAGGDGTANAGLVDTFFMVVAPPLAFMSGIGVLRRNRIAWLALIVLLMLTALHFTWAWATANPGTTREVTASGVLVTTIGSNPSTHLPPLAACLLLLVPLLTRRARAVFMAEQASSAPLATTSAGATPASTTPAGAMRAQVFAAVQAPAPQAATAHRNAATPAAQRAQGMQAVYLVLALLVGTAGGAGWMLVDGLRTDETWFPGARPSYSRTVARADEPVNYWLSLGLYTLVAGGALAGTAWLVRNATWRGERA